MQQMALSFEPGLAQRYGDMRECFAACVYKVGLGRVAAAVDAQPSNLSAMLSGARSLDPALIEKYMQHFGDTTPAMFWAARWLQDSETLQKQARAALPALIEQLTRLAKEANA